MNRDELIIKARNSGLPISESKIRRYVQYGLVITLRSSRGRGKGATPVEYNNRSLETLKEIQKYAHIKNEQLIYTLYWTGYPVAWEKLKQRLLVYISSVESDLSTVANLTLDPGTLEYLVTEMANDSLPSLRPGRPSKEDQDKLEQKRFQIIQFNKFILAFITDLMIRKNISVETITRLMEIKGVNLSKESLFTSLEFPNFERIKLAIHHSDEKDYILISEIIVCLKEYWDVFRKQVHNFSTISPLINNFTEQINYHYPGGFVSGNTSLIRLIILILLTFDNYEQILEILKSDNTKSAFSLFCQQLTQKMNIKGGENDE